MMRLFTLLSTTMLVAATLTSAADTPATADASSVSFPSPCAPAHTLCGSAGTSFSSLSPVCCPNDSSVCQRTRHGYQCLPIAEANACDACCGGGQCTFATGQLTATAPTDKSPSVMVPEFKSLQCCGVGEAGRSFCCPTRMMRASHGVESGVMRPTPVAQQCKASPHAWSCVDAPASVMHLQVSLMLWQIILCAVGGVLFCSAFGVGGHRAHSGRCSDDCQALTACCAGCALFECCAGGRGMNAPLLG